MDTDAQARTWRRYGAGEKISDGGKAKVAMVQMLGKNWWTQLLVAEPTMHPETRKVRAGNKLLKNVALLEPDGKSVAADAQGCRLESARWMRRNRQ